MTTVGYLVDGTGRWDQVDDGFTVPSRPAVSVVPVPSNTVISPDYLFSDWRGSPQPSKPPNIVGKPFVLPIIIRCSRRPGDCVVHRIALSWFLQVSIHWHFLRETKLHRKICAPLLYRNHACKGSVRHSLTFSRDSVARFQILQCPSCEVQKIWTLVSDSVVVVACSCRPSKGSPWRTQTTPSRYPTPINTIKKTCGEA